MSYRNPLGDREHAIEEAYFQKENRRLIDRMRARRQAAEKGEEPAELAIETILVATDFSMHAAHATDMAIDTPDDLVRLETIATRTTSP